MKKYNNILKAGFLLILYLITFEGSAQHFPIRFNHLTTRDGLSHNRVSAIYKDQLGYMWFGSLSGLNRFNGYEFKVLKHDPINPNSLKDNSITHIGAGPKDYLWIKTSSGYSAYDIYKEQFVDVTPILDSLGIFPGNIMRMIRDSDNNTYIAGLEAGVKIINDSGRISAIDSNYKGSVTDITFDSFGNLLILYTQGYLEIFDIKAEKIIKSLQLQDINSNHQLSLYSDSNNGIWVWSESRSIGLLYFEDEMALPKKFGESIIGSEVVTAVIEDKSGQIIVATDHGGMTLINKSNWSHSNYKNDPADNKSLSHNCAISLYYSDDGMVWIGTNKAGVNSFYAGGASFKYLNYKGENAALHNDINAIVEDDEGNFWIGSDGAGLLHYNRNNNIFESYNPDLKSSDNLYANIIVSMKKDGPGLWIGTYQGGLIYFDGKKFKKRFNNPESPDALSDDSIWEIFKDSKGNLWIGTLKGGVDVYSPGFKKIHHFSLNNKRLNSNYITSIAEDKNANIWIGTGYGIEVYNPETNEIKHYLNNINDINSIQNNSIVDIHICDEGEIWIGTQGGVSKYDPVRDNFLHFTEKDGLVSNFIVSVIEDETGSIWVGTNKGLSKISFEDSRYKIQNFDEADGLQGDTFNPGAVLKTKSGELAFGGFHGFNVFNPNEIREISNSQNLVFTDFYISNKRINPEDNINGRRLFTDGLNKTGKIDLKHFENSFTFEFAALRYDRPDKTLYRYMLEGFDQDWITITSDQRRVNFTNLDPGDYAFKVQASNGQGKWDQDEIQMALTIQTPLWETPFAFAIYGIIVLGIYLGIRKVIIDRERLKAQMMHDKFETDRLRQLDLMKIRFFTNVSHEFRTPLTLILTPIERLLQNSSDGTSQNDYLMIRRNAKRLLSLVNQLLDFRKIESGQLSLTTSGGDIIAFMKDIVESFSDLAREKNIAIQIKSDIPDFLTTFDRDKMEKIMFNLLSNAFKFTRSGGSITVELSDKGENEGKNFLEIKVTDTGIGIPEDKLENIFTRFFQIETPANILNHGSGIGLSITKEFVELHGGTIRAESVIGKGSCFIVELPLKKINTGDEAIIEFLDEDLMPLQHLPQQWDKDKYTVLLAEDNSDFRFYLQDNLKQYFNILEAGNGKDAWRLAMDNLPDIIVSDLMMPVMNGVDLIKKIKKDPRTAHIPVILLTAHYSDEYKLESLDAGAIEYLTKPFNFEILISSIKSSLNFQEQVRKSGNLLEVSPAEIEVTSLDEKLIRNALKLIEENMENAEFSVQELSHELGVSRGQLYKKILAITGLTPIEFIRGIRLKRAVVLLQKSQLTVAEVAYKVGFNNPRYFARYFKEAYKCLPSKYEKKAQSEV